MDDCTPPAETARTPASAHALIDLLPYQKAAVESNARFTWNCWSRQTGKSFTFSLRRILRGLVRRRNQIILSAGERQSREVMAKVRMHLQAMQICASSVGLNLFDTAAGRSLEVRLPGNVRIIALPANPMTARGYTGDVFLDEFAMHRDDEAIWSALFPTLLRGDGELDIASTPRGKRNLFYRLRNHPRFESTTLTLQQAIDAGLAANAADVRESIGDEFAWRQEFCCEFLDDASAFLPLELIQACVDPEASIDPAHFTRDDQIYIGIDIGRLRDLTAIWIWRVRDEVFETASVITLAQTAFDEQERIIGELLSHKAVRRACIDAGGMGLHLSERLVNRFSESRVEPVVLTAALKEELATQLRLKAECEQLRIPNDRSVIEDWQSITRLISPSGVTRFVAERTGNGHGDRFWAAALGLRAASLGSVSHDIDFITARPLRFGGQGIW